MRLIDADALLAEYDRVHVGPPGGARKLIEDAPEVPPKVVAEIKIDGEELQKAVDEAVEHIKAELFENSEQLDTISRAEAIDALRTCYETETISMDDGDEYINYGDAVAEIEQLPSAQPERVKGHWIEIASSNHTYKCSVCGRLLVNIMDGKDNVAKNYPYCHCGADMRGEKDG